MPKESVIKHYSSSTTGSAPAAIDLVAGELAINTADEKIFFKNLAGSVIDIGSSKGISGVYAKTTSIGNGTLTMNVSGTGLAGSQTFTANQSGNATFTVTSNATNANTGSTIVARDASGNFSAGTISAALNGNASTATSAATLTTARSINGTSFNGGSDITTTNWGTARNITIGDSTVSVNGSTNYTWTAVGIGATSTNTANKIVMRDASGNFSAGTITATLNGNASTATTATSATTATTATSANTLTTARSINGTSFNGGADITTTNWGTGRTITIGDTGKSVNGSTNYTWTAVEIGATSTNTANKIVMRDANGDFTGRYIFAQYFNHSHGAAYRGADTQFYSSTDDYIRKNTKAGFLASLGLTNTASVNTVGTIVLRDGSGNFSAGTITATLSGTATQVSNALTIGSGLAGTSSTYNGSAAVTIANTGVLSLNGLTGARTLTGDGGAIFGTANTTIAARLATASLTGVASFPATDFAVSAAGAVTLTGNVAKTNVAQTFTAFQNFTSGLSGNLTGNATTATTWQTGRTITIGNTGKSVNGGGNVSWSLSEIGVPAANAVVNSVVVGGATLTGNVSLTAGSNITLTPSGSTITIASTASGGGGVTTTAANTWTATQTFSGGINVSAGATFSGSIESNGYRIGSGAINAQTTAYTLAASDNGKVITVNSASAVNLTVGTAVGTTGFSCSVIQLGAGQVTIVASSTTLNSYNGLKIAGQHGAASIVCYATNVFNVAGNMTT